jgi:hypothetical protein
MHNMAIQQEEQQMFGFAHVARRWGVSPDTVRRLAESGYLHAIYIAGRRLVPLAEVLRVELVGVGKGRKRAAAKSRAV